MMQATMWAEIADLPHTLEYVQVGPWRTRVLTVGAGEQTLVLLNGTSGHIEAWTHNIRALAKKYKVIGYDYPGHGYSTLAEADLEIPDYEEHLLNLLDVLGLDKVHLLGESLGGWIAIKFAAHHPERLHTIVLSAPGGRMVASKSMDRVSPVSRKAVEDPSYENVKARLQVVIHDPEQITDELVEVRRAIYGRPDFITSMEHIMALQVPDIRARNQVTKEDYAAIPVPALLVWTDHEPTGGVATGETLAAAIPDGEFALIRNAAHWPQWEDPTTFNEKALDFLSRKA
ncbi:alpha/beta fold hydrolase [Paenarthrobacter ureafaciens]|uniref:alpha/beta fold hydrolase n=1 Tax=Paenarthrobacter ureafaciens TaxID=37931 RepID=UPI001FB20200|nr:alpha/beta hydrolase [Paenarthrobacter ureafaciens]UOD81227.1 alpha/beta fold hydrolase [Paenarthrobacter ureafaciens]WNZ03877.1 alpha/beta hydrolase [Paenarthrobacter ureafaciens]